MVKENKDNGDEKVEVDKELGTTIEVKVDTEMGIEKEATVENGKEIGIEIAAEEDIIRETRAEEEIKEVAKITGKHIKESSRLNIIIIRTTNITMIKILEIEVKAEKDRLVNTEQDLKLQMELDTEGKVQEELYSTEVEVRVMKERY